MFKVFNFFENRNYKYQENICNLGWIVCPMGLHQPKIQLSSMFKFSLVLLCTSIRHCISNLYLVSGLNIGRVSYP